jgi:hypothetical protein
MPVAVFLFVLGAVAALVGDHSHIVTGTTEYLSDAVPLVWSSPIWFPILVGAATVSVAELRLHLPAPRTSVTARHGLAGVAAVIGPGSRADAHAPAVPVNVLVYSLAAITWCALGDCYGAVCGAIAAVVGPAVEAVLAAAGLVRYAEDSDAPFGVAPWLPALYFAFGVVTALLAEIATSSVDSAPKAALRE